MAVDCENESPGEQARTPAPSAALLFVIVTLLWSALLGVRLVTPPDLADKDQERTANYIMDITQNGNWLCQTDVWGEISSKPPLYTWLAALPTLAVGRITRFVMNFPSWASTLLLAWLVMAAGAAAFGRGAGFWGAVAYLLSMTGLRQILLARTDALFALMVFAGCLCVYRAWLRGRGWTWPWLLAAAATVTKGPLGVLLMPAGLIAAFWEKRSGKSLRIRGAYLWGVLLYLAVVLGWFGSACVATGGRAYDKMMVEEFYTQAVSSAAGRAPGEMFFRPFLFFFSRYLPWSIAACYAFWRVCRRPSEAPEERRFARFLFCYFAFGVLVFSVGAHQRPDHLMPLLPAAAILAGREIARLAAPRRPARYFAGLTGIIVCVLILSLVYYGPIESRKRDVITSITMEKFAPMVEAKAPGLPLMFVDVRYTCQIYFGVRRPFVTYARAAQALAGPDPAFVVVRDLAKLKDNLKLLKGVTLHELARWPLKGKPRVRLVSNQSRLARPDRCAIFVRDTLLRMSGVRLEQIKDNILVFRAEKPDYKLEVSNQGKEPLALAALIRGPEPKVRREGVLKPGQTWRLAGAKDGAAGFRPESCAPLWLRFLTASGFFLALTVGLVFAGRKVVSVVALSQRW